MHKRNKAERTRTNAYVNQTYHDLLKKVRESEGYSSNADQKQHAGTFVYAGLRLFTLCPVSKNGILVDGKRLNIATRLSRIGPTEDIRFMMLGRGQPSV